ncbi:uncharacterized protein lrrfip1b isoform X2 [Cyclopterus lumpus]|uniref:uncharacterized protein lrrfip1b isoform X2 n=1 Tax=Cyclopterus lumpus TaxID=8103 RepID=UPI001486C536|nr:uncharacterized protein lrrfip1b isoform X2 [Cyclopterus lumpus]
MEDSAPGKTTMGTQGPGRKRIPNQEKRTAEDDSLNQVAREAEARLAARRAARAEAREIRMKELERQHKEEDSERYARHSRRHTSMSDDEERMSVGSRSSLRPSDYSGFLGSSSRASSRASSARASPVVEERPDRDFMDKVSRTASTLSAATLASLGGASSRRGSCDTSFSVETEASIRDMKDSLAQAEDRYRKAMVSNAQLHNEKSSLMFQVENLKEELGDMEELLWENRRHWDDRTKEVERERQARLLLQLRLTEMEEALRRSEEMLTEVSDLRLKSSSYCQEVSDLQEVLQWKEKKMAALEKQREISDIVRIERDRLRNDVVRLRDLLKKHGVIFSPEFSTNGETGPGEDDDVSAESDPRLAESTLGEVQERQPAEGIKLPQARVEYNRSRIRKLSVISDSDLTKTLVKGFDKQARDQTGKHPRKSEDARKLPRNKGSEKDPIKKFRIGQFRNEGIKKQRMKKPHSEPVSSNRDVLVAEVERSFEHRICNIQTNLNVRRAATEKVHKSRLVPPQLARDLILDNKAVVPRFMAAGKLNSPTQKKVLMGNETPSSCKDVAQKCSSAVVRIFHNQVKVGNICRDESCSEGEGVMDIPALGAKEYKIDQFSTPTSADSLKENEFVDESAEIDGDKCEGGRFVYQDTKVLRDLVENDTVVSMAEASHSLQQQPEDLGSTQNEDEVLKVEGDGNCSSVPEGPSLETKLKPSELDAFLPAEEAIVDGQSGTQEAVRKAVQIKEKSQVNSFECPECTNRTKTPTTPLVPIEVWTDRSCLEKTIQSMLRGFVENQGFSAEISSIVPEISDCLNQWISDFEKRIKNVEENVSNQGDSVDLESTEQMMGIELQVEGELPLKDLQERTERTEEPGSEEQSAARDSTLIKGMSEVASLEVHPQTYDVSVGSSVREDLQDPPASDDQEASEDNLGGRFPFKVEVTESYHEEMLRVNSVDRQEEKQSQSDPTVASRSEELVFIEFYFAEHAKTQSAPADEVVETQLKRHRTLSTNSQSSKVRRLLEITADEIKAMAVPELLLMRLQEGTIVEDHHIDESSVSSTEDQEESSVGHIDSCEEVGEETLQQPATQQQPAMQVGLGDVEVVPAASSMKLRSGEKRVGLQSRKYKHKTDCQIS